MSERIRVPGLDHGEQDVLDRLVTQWRAKRRRNNLRSGFYDMKNSEREIMSAEAPESVKRRSFVLGWSAAAVDKLNRRCNLDGFHDAAGSDLANFGLSELVRQNHLISELSMVGKGALKHAVGWIITTRGVDGEPPVVVLGREATSGTGIWNARARAMGSFLSIAETDDSGEPRAMVMYLPNLILDMEKKSTGWVVDRRGHKDGVPVDPLTYQPDLDRRFGRSRITRAVMSLHVQALGAMVRADVNGEAYSLPRLALMGATEEAFKNADGSSRPTWQAAWKAVWAVGDDEELAEQGNPLARADIKQLNGQSPEPQNAHLRMLAQMFSGETGISIGELGIIGDANPTSAEALQVAKDDMMTEAIQTMDGWTPGIASAARRALVMLNDGDVPDSFDPRPTWRKPILTSPAAAADAAAKTLASFPWLAETEVGLELAGLTPSQVERATAERRRAAGQRNLQQLIAGDSGDQS